MTNASLCLIAFNMRLPRRDRRTAMHPLIHSSATTYVPYGCPPLGSALQGRQERRLPPASISLSQDKCFRGKPLLPAGDELCAALAVGRRRQGTHHQASKGKVACNAVTVSSYFFSKRNWNGVSSWSYKLQSMSYWLQLTIEIRKKYCMTEVVSVKKCWRRYRLLD